MAPEIGPDLGLWEAGEHRSRSVAVAQPTCIFPFPLQGANGCKADSPPLYLGRSEPSESRSVAADLIVNDEM